MTKITKQQKSIDCSLPTTHLNLIAVTFILSCAEKDGILLVLYSITANTENSSTRPPYER